MAETTRTPEPSFSSVAVSGAHQNMKLEPGVWSSAADLPTFGSLSSSPTNMFTPNFEAPVFSQQTNSPVPNFQTELPIDEKFQIKMDQNGGLEAENSTVHNNIWNPVNGESPLPMQQQQAELLGHLNFQQQQQPHPDHVLMMKMMILRMNMEQKAAAEAAGLLPGNGFSDSANNLPPTTASFGPPPSSSTELSTNTNTNTATSSSLPVVDPGLFLRLNELQMANQMAAAFQQQQSQNQNQFVFQQEQKAEVQPANAEPAVKPKPKRIRKPKQQPPANTSNGQQQQSNNVPKRNRSVSANRQLVPGNGEPSTTLPPKMQMTPLGLSLGPNPIYRCHLCPYTGNSKQHFNAHMNTHFDHKCPHCDYTSRTEGRLKRHINDFHSETPPDSWSGNRTRDPNDPSPDDGFSGGEDGDEDGDDSCGPNPARNRKYRCKQCNYVAILKHDYWEHTKAHIKEEKMLNCPKCNFVTEFKHHLVYHLRNHFGSKPFKCAKCNYSCVNKSMLNSHMKSHSNIYQYRCEDCTYATKYCHSLKLHLRKYAHRPATVLNLDGTPNPYPVIDVYGTRRGPRPKKGALAAIAAGLDQIMGEGGSVSSDQDYPPQDFSSQMEMGMFEDNDEEIGMTKKDDNASKPQNLSISSPGNFFEAPVINAITSSSMNFSPPLSVTTTTISPIKQIESITLSSNNGNTSISPRTSGGGGNSLSILKCDYCPFQTECKTDFSNHLLEHVRQEKKSLLITRKADKAKAKSALAQPQTLSENNSTTPPLTPLTISPTNSSVNNNGKRPSSTNHHQQNNKFAHLLPPLEPIQSAGVQSFYANFPPNYPPEFGSLFGSGSNQQHRFGVNSFPAGELTPPTPTIEDNTFDNANCPGQFSAANFKPLDLSGKQNVNPSLMPHPEMLQSAPNPMALLLMNSFLLNAQRNLKDVFEASNDDGKDDDNDNGKKQHSFASDEDENDKYENDEEEEEVTRSSSSAENVTGNYFEQLLRLQQSKELAANGETEIETNDNQNGKEESGHEGDKVNHQLPPTPSKSPNKGPNSIFDFTEEEEEMKDDQSQGRPSSSASGEQQHPHSPESPPLAPAVLQLLAQLLQANPGLNPALIVQQLLPQLLLLSENNSNSCSNQIADVGAILSKVFSATSLMQEILLEMSVRK